MIDVASLARSVAREEDHVTALELAQWIKDRRPGLRVLDLRSPEEYTAYHVPRAEHLSLDSLATTTFRADETIVLYSEGGPHAAQAWVFLRALGYQRVFFLRGGLYEWLEQVLNPILAEGRETRPNSSPVARAKPIRPSIASIAERQLAARPRGAIAP